MNRNITISIIILLLLTSINPASALIEDSIEESIIANIVAAIIIGMVLIIGKPYIPMVLANPLLLILALVAIFMVLSYLR